MTERLLTVEEFAQRTRQHKETIRRQIRRGAIATIQTGRKHLIPESLATTPTTQTQRTHAGETAPVNIGAHLPEVPPLDLSAYFAPPTPAEIARRLAALETLGEGHAPHKGGSSGKRGTQSAAMSIAAPDDPVRYDRDERAARLMEGHR